MSARNDLMRFGMLMILVAVGEVIRLKHDVNLGDLGMALGGLGAGHGAVNWRSSNGGDNDAR